MKFKHKREMDKLINLVKVWIFKEYGFNGIKSAKILPLELYSIESVDPFNSNLYLVHKKKI